MADSKTWDERYAGKALVWSAGPNALFREVVDQLPAGTALDLACGEGRNALYLAERGWRVSAMDFSGVGIDKARQIARHRNVDVNWIVGDVCEAPFGGPYDLVSVVFLHTSPAQRAVWFPRAADAVSGGGTFLYIGHDPANISEGVGGPQDPSVLPSADTLAASLPGFDVLRAEVVSRSVESDPGHGGGSGIALDTLVLARRR